MSWIYACVLICGGMLLAFAIWQYRKANGPESPKVVQHTEPPDHVGVALRHRASRAQFVPRARERR